MLEEPNIVRILWSNNKNKGTMEIDDYLENLQLANDDNKFVLAWDPEIFEGDERKERLHWEYSTAHYNGWVVCGPCFDNDLEDGVYPFRVEGDGVVNTGNVFVRRGQIDIYHFSHQLIYSAAGDHCFIEGFNIDSNGIWNFFCGS